MAGKALDVLDHQSRGSRRGFFLQIEGASIDKQDHDTATLVTRDSANMTISYATSEITGSQQHTGTEVRIAAAGPQAANVLGVTGQTDLFTTMGRALGLR